MRAMKHEMLLVVAATLVFGAAATLITSKLHWGYWVSPPSPDATVTLLRHLESFTTMWRGYPPHSGHDALVKAAEDVNWSSGDDPRKAACDSDPTRLCAAEFRTRGGIAASQNLPSLGNKWRAAFSILM